MLLVEAKCPGYRLQGNSSEDVFETYCSSRYCNWTGGIGTMLLCSRCGSIQQSQGQLWYENSWLTRASFCTGRMLGTVCRKKEALTPAVDHHGNWERANKIYFGPERDMKNFPHLERAEFHKPVRHRLVPEEWFTALYKRTGVSGPYVLFGGMTTFLLSKEILEFNDELLVFCLFCGYFLPFLGRKANGRIGEYLDKRTNLMRMRYIMSQKPGTWRP